MSATRRPWESDGRIEKWLGGSMAAVRVSAELEPGSGIWSPVCMVHPNGAGPYGASGSRDPVADAALIVRAVNSFDSLLAVAKAVSACHCSAEQIEAIYKLDTAHPDWRIW